MSAIRTLKRNIRERTTGQRPLPRKPNRGGTPGTRKRRRLARRRRAIAKATKLSRTGG